MTKENAEKLKNAIHGELPKSYNLNGTETPLNVMKSHNNAVELCAKAIDYVISQHTCTCVSPIDMQDCTGEHDICPEHGGCVGTHTV